MYRAKPIGKYELKLGEYWRAWQAWRNKTCL